MSLLRNPMRLVGWSEKSFQIITDYYEVGLEKIPRPQIKKGPSLYNQQNNHRQKL